MSLTIPAGSILQNTSNEGNTVTWALPGHTVQKPKLLILKRTVPTYNSGKSVWSDPKYQYKVVYGVVDADANPVKPLIQIGTEGITWPMAGVDVQTTFASALATFQAVTASIVALDIMSQVLPNCCAAE